MADSLHQKKLYLDYSNHLELCLSATPEQPPALTNQPVGTGLCTLLNIGLPRLQRLRAHLSQMLPLTAQDPDAYAIMVSIKLGNVPLPDSEFAAKLFSLLDTIADLGDVFYLAIQMDKLLNLFEEGAPEKTILKQLATTAARAAAALDAAVIELPLYQKRVDAIFNYTEFDRVGITEVAPVLSRALAYQQQSSDFIMQFKNAVSYRLFSREGEHLTELIPETAAPDHFSGLFYGDLLAHLPFGELVRLMFQQMLLSDTVVRVCGVCGRYFVPTVRSNEKYCDFVSVDSDGTALSCKQRSTKTRLETDTSLKLLKGAYDKNFIKSGRKKDPDYRTLVFRPWYQWAKQQRALYLEGEIALEMLTERLHRDMDSYLEESSAAIHTPVALPCDAQESSNEQPFAAEPDQVGNADEDASGNDTDENDRTNAEQDADSTDIADETGTQENEVTHSGADAGDDAQESSNEQPFAAEPDQVGDAEDDASGDDTDENDRTNAEQDADSTDIADETGAQENEVTHSGADAGDDEEAVTESYLEDPSEEPEAPAGRSRWKFPWFGQ